MLPRVILTTAKGGSVLLFHFTEQKAEGQAASGTCPGFPKKTSRYDFKVQNLSPVWSQSPFQDSSAVLLSLVPYSSEAECIFQVIITNVKSKLFRDWYFM